MVFRTNPFFIMVSASIDNCFLKTPLEQSEQGVINTEKLLTPMFIHTCLRAIGIVVKTRT